MREEANSEQPRTTAKLARPAPGAAPGSARQPSPDALNETPSAPDRGNVGQDVQADIWVKCPGCKEIAYRKEVERNLNVCLKCGYHHRLTVEQRLAVTADRGSWRELHADLAGGDPLEFRDSKAYPDRLAQARAAS